MKEEPGDSEQTLRGMARKVEEMDSTMRGHKEVQEGKTSRPSGFWSRRNIASIPCWLSAIWGIPALLLSTLLVAFLGLGGELAKSRDLDYYGEHHLLAAWIGLVWLFLLLVLLLSLVLWLAGFLLGWSARSQDGSRLRLWGLVALIVVVIGQASLWFLSCRLLMAGFGQCLGWEMESGRPFGMTSAAWVGVFVAIGISIGMAVLLTLGTAPKERLAGPAAESAEGLPPSEKSRFVTSLLGILFGMFGAHRFYVGRTATGVGMALVTTLGLMTTVAGVATLGLTMMWLVGMVFLVAAVEWAVFDLVVTVAGKEGGSRMKCPKCQKENPTGADYCVWCGTHLVGGLGPWGQPLSATDGLPEIKRHLNEMAVRLSKVEQRVTVISTRMNLEPVEMDRQASAKEVVPEVQPETEIATESALAEAATPETPAPRPIIEPITVQETRSSELQAEVGAEAPSTEKMVPAKPAPDELVMATPVPVRRAPEKAAKTPSVSARPIQKPPKPPQPSQFATRLRDWEQALPGNWLSRIGIIALFIGLGFLAKLAYDRDWIGPVIQLLAGLGCGGVLLLAGHHWRKMYHVWAQALTGGGIAVLYLSIFASYTLNDLMSFFPTFALMFLVTLLAVATAVRRESMAIAIIGIVGAFLVPIILGASDLYRGVDGDTGSNPGLMIGYILVLDAGIVGLSTFRKWRWFTLLGLGGSLAVYGLWYATSGHDGSVAVAEWSLTGIFACFVAATTLFHVIWRRSPELSDMALMSLNAAIYFCVSYGLLWGDYRSWLGLFSVALAGLYAMTGYLAWRRSEDNRRLSLFAFGIAIVFLTIAIPVQLHRSYASWITAAWAVEGAALIWIAVRQNMPKWQLWGLGAFAMALVGLFAFNGAIDEERFRPFINDTFWAFTIAILAFYSAAYSLRRHEDALQPWFFPAMMLTASVLTVWLFSGEIVSFAESRILQAHARGATFLELRNIENARSLGLVSLWVAYGLGLLVAGTRKNWDWLRVAGYGLMAVACGVTVALLNHSHAVVRSSDSQPFINFGFGGFTICTIALYLSARVIAENGEKLRDFDRLVCVVALAAANVLTLWALSAEIVTFVNQPENLRSLVLVILWSGYGLLLMLAGAWRGIPMARFGGYALIGVAAGMALILLNHGQAGVQRTNSNWVANYSFGGLFVCICTIYLAVYLIANHSSKLLAAEKVVLPVLIVVANALSLFALSSEVLTYVESGYGKSMGLTLLWAAYGLALVVVGIVGRWAWVRLGGLALVSIAILKLFIVDTFTLQAGYRVAAYLILGVLLLAGGFVYHRYADVIKGFIMDRPGKGTGSAQK